MVNQSTYRTGLAFMKTIQFTDQIAYKMFFLLFTDQNAAIHTTT